MTRFATGLVVLVLAWAAVEAQDPARLFKEAINTEVVVGDLTRAIEQYQKVVDSGDRALAAQALSRQSEIHRMRGDQQAQQRVDERIAREYGDRPEASAARARVAAMQALPSQSGPVARQVWTGYVIGGGEPGAPSPDGRFLSIGDLETGNLAVRDLRTNTLHRLTNGGWGVNGDHATSPVISPDGRQIAYEWVIDRERRNELRVASFAGAEPVRPATVLRQEGGDYIRNIAWTPDGKRLVVFRSLPDRTSQIGIVTIEDGSFQSLKSLGWVETGLLSLSPDGRYVAYDVPAVEAGSPRDIFVLATDGSGEATVVRNPANDSHPLWSSDGSQLLFLSDRSGMNDLWSIPMSDGHPGGTAALVRAHMGAMTRLMGMTRSGTLYYYVPPARRRDLWIAELDPARVVAKPSAPLTDRPLSENFGASWSDDGAYLAYYAFRATSRDATVKTLVVRSAKTGDEQTLPLPGRVQNPRGEGPKWFPGNQAVLLLIRDPQGAGAGFYRLAIDTGNTELLAHIPRETDAYDLSRDGRSIVYLLGPAVMRVDILSRRETQVVGGLANALALSPDGSQLAIWFVGGSVGIVPAEGGQLREVHRPSVRVANAAMFNALTWTPSQSHLLFAHLDNTLWKVPVTGGEAEPVGVSMTAIKSIAVHPNGSRVVYSAIGGDPGSPVVWSLENFLPAAR